MPTIAANTYRLPIVDKLLQGAVIIAKSTDNPDVPGNEAAVTRLAAAQAAFAAANAAFESIRLQAKELLSARDNAVAEWNSAINSLAALTESITGGDPAKILGTGFGVRSPKSPTQAVEQISEVLVSYDLHPGYSIVEWKPLENASVYRVQCCPGATPDGVWKESGTSTESMFRANGATPGQPCWYRVAAINSLGQGPWSAPAPRPVM